MPTSIFAQLDQACPVAGDGSCDVITVVIDERHPLGKKFRQMPDGTIDKQAEVAVARGLACQYHVPDLGTLEQLLRIVSENPNAAICNAGWKHAVLGERFAFLSSAKLAERGLEREAVTTDSGLPAFARIKDHATPSTWQLLDRDVDRFTPQMYAEQSFNEWRQQLDIIIPGLAKVKMLRAHSSSARVVRADGSAAGGGNGHVWIKIVDAADAERTRAAIMARAFEYDLAWPKPRMSKSTGLECGKGFATIVDPTVWTLGRLVFVGRPTCCAELTIKPQVFDLIEGDDDRLDTAKAVVNGLKTFRASHRQGAPLRLERQGTGYRAAMKNLRLDTEIELADGSVKSVGDLMPNLTQKLRCQSPFRSSQSFAAFIALDARGEPFVFDSGTDTRHVLEKSVTSSSSDKDRESLIREIKDRVGTLIGLDNVMAVFDEATLRAAWDSTFCTPNNSKLVVLNRNDEVVDLSVGDAKSFGFNRSFGRVFHMDMLEEVIAEKALSLPEAETLRKNFAYLEHGPFVERLKLLKQAKSLSISIDMFAKRGKMTVADGIATIVLPHRRFVPKTIVEAGVVYQVISDYKMHFPEFTDFIDVVLHARFATDRRHAFVWLHSPSSWGKGFLLAILAELGLVVEIPTAEIEKAMAGGPVGLSLIDTLRTWILFVDEFKAASSELKLLNRQISISPKNQLRCSVQLYTKLFASAENVRSLVGDGVEAQFNNRFAYLLPSTHAQKLEDRPLYKELGKATYMAALVNYVARYINDGVTRLCAMGATESSKVADNFIEAYQSQRRLQQTFGALDEAVDDKVAEIRRCLIEYARWTIDGGQYLSIPGVVKGIGPQLLGTLQRTAHIGFVSDGDNSKQRHQAIVLGESVSFVKCYIALSGDRSTVSKMQYKAEVIAEQLNMRPDVERVRVYACDYGKSSDASEKPKRGIVIFLDIQPVSLPLAAPPWANP